MNAEIIALHDDIDLHARACGKITFWTLLGEVGLSAFAGALAVHAPDCAPPEAPSAAVALHRAVVALARETGDSVHSTRRGHWSIVGKPRQEDTQIVYDVRMNAHLDGDRLVVDFAPYEHRLQECYEAAKAVLTPQDVSAWLCKKLDALGAVALRESGGFYFVPKDTCAPWEAIGRALRGASSHTLHAIPALKSQDAVSAIFEAITNATQSACDQITRDVQGAGLGRRALETRQRETAELLDRVVRYEALLGMELDTLREATTSVRAGIAAAILSLASESDAE